MNGKNQERIKKIFIGFVYAMPILVILGSALHHLAGWNWAPLSLAHALCSPAILSFFFLAESFFRSRNRNIIIACLAFLILFVAIFLHLLENKKFNLSVFSGQNINLTFDILIFFFVLAGILYQFMQIFKIKQEHQAYITEENSNASQETLVHADQEKQSKEMDDEQNLYMIKCILSHKEKYPKEIKGIRCLLDNHVIQQKIQMSKEEIRDCAKLKTDLDPIDEEIGEEKIAYRSQYARLILFSTSGIYLFTMLTHKASSKLLHHGWHIGFLIFVTMAYAALCFYVHKEEKLDYEARLVKNAFDKAKSSSSSQEAHHIREKQVNQSNITGSRASLFGEQKLKTKQSAPPQKGQTQKKNNLCS